MTQIDKAFERANGRVIEYGRDGFAAAADCNGVLLRVIGSWGAGWDHVSVSLADRCPTWDEMCFIKDLCFFDNECVMQLHVPKENHVNYHPFCLHLWKPTARGLDIPRPGKELVGGVAVEVKYE